MFKFSPFHTLIWKNQKHITKLRLWTL